MGIGNAPSGGEGVRGRSPHYPSWGSVTPWRTTTAQAPRTSSLPLMGIGNSAAAFGAIPHKDGTHYPSWGSVTRCCRRRRTSTRWSHYPSWGSVTPAGDGPRREIGDSLPLMGIGNEADIDGDEDVDWWDSHYPSWGSVTVRRRAQQKAPVFPHYPSWGSVTGRREQPHHRQGDTHYPSWGSVTGEVVGLAHGCFSNSLPLMGIGNRPGPGPGRLLARAHYPSWGSVTPALPAPRRDPGPLITPHGDR